MATGEYIGLFDHDDILHPSVLFEDMRAICDHDADFVYTDEATFEGENITKIITFHFKPDFAIDNLRANNYICHFSVFARELVEEAGLFRSAYDGSQDHDMVFLVIFPDFPLVFLAFASQFGGTGYRFQNVCD